MGVGGAFWERGWGGGRLLGKGAGVGGAELRSLALRDRGLAVAAGAGGALGLAGAAALSAPPDWGGHRAGLAG